jgi:hypothetical protein
VTRGPAIFVLVRIARSPATLRSAVLGNGRRERPVAVRVKRCCGLATAAWLTTTSLPLGRMDHSETGGRSTWRSRTQLACRLRCNSSAEWLTFIGYGRGLGFLA